MAGRDIFSIVCLPCKVYVIAALLEEALCVLVLEMS